LYYHPDSYRENYQIILFCHPDSYRESYQISFPFLQMECKNKAKWVCFKLFDQSFSPSALITMEFLRLPQQFCLIFVYIL